MRVADCKAVKRYVACKLEEKQVREKRRVADRSSGMGQQGILQEVEWGGVLVWPQPHIDDAALANGQNASPFCSSKWNRVYESTATFREGSMWVGTKRVSK